MTGHRTPFVQYLLALIWRHYRIEVIRPWADSGDCDCFGNYLGGSFWFHDFPFVVSLSLFRSGHLLCFLADGSAKYHLVSVAEFQPVRKLVQSGILYVGQLLDTLLNLGQVEESQ